LGERIRIAGRHEHAATGEADDLGQSAHRGGDHRGPAGHGFDRRQTKTLIARWNHDQRSLLVAADEFGGFELACDL
jgi:hypothetical protein